MTLAEILETLKQPIPNQMISQKETFRNDKKTGQRYKSGEVDYIAWYDVTDILDDRCGLGRWEWTIKDVHQIGENLTLIGCLTIYGDDRHLTMMATGCESVNCSGYGDPSSNAEAMALRRCCAKFGLGRDLWRKDKPKQFNQPKTTKPGELTREEWLKRKAQHA